WYNLVVISATEVLVRLVVDVLLDEVHRPVHKAEVCTARVVRFGPPGNVPVPDVVCRPRTGRATPTQIIPVDWIVDGLDGLHFGGVVEHGPTTATVITLEFVLGDPGLADQERVGGPIRYVRDPDLRAAARSTLTIQA